MTHNTALKKLLASRVTRLKNVKNVKFLANKFNNSSSHVFLNNQEITKENILWANSSCHQIESNLRFFHQVKEKHIKLIVPRCMKDNEDKKKRTVSSAEVFTPQWLVSEQTQTVDQKEFDFPFYHKKGLVTKCFVKNSYTDTNWYNYVSMNVLELACGEAPYLVNPYNPITGEHNPVKINGKYTRIGILDKKLILVSEYCDSMIDWVAFSMVALKTTYGVEYQGDNLYLARKNILQTIMDYFSDKFGEELDEDIAGFFAEVISWNFIQLDALKGVTPGTCSITCPGCKKDFNSSECIHDGKTPVTALWRVPSLRQMFTFEGALNATRLEPTPEEVTLSPVLWARKKEKPCFPTQNKVKIKSLSKQ